MRVPLVTAVADSTWESRLVAAIERGGLGLTVVRRCVDVADLIATAGTGYARAAVVSADLPRLDRDAVARLDELGVVVLGLVPPGGGAAGERLRNLGVPAVLFGDTPPEEVATLIRAAVASVGPRATEGAPRVRPMEPPPAGTESEPPGQLVAVWGPTGAPGRTTLAINLAAELCQLGVPAVLVDADSYGGTVAQRLGLLEDAPGIAGAARAANQGTLDTGVLAGLLRAVALPGGSTLRVMTGILRPQRWPELSAAALGPVLDQLRAAAPVAVFDCGFCIEADEEIAYDMGAPRRNAATLTALAAGQRVLAVGAADPVGLARLLRGLGDLRDVLPAVRPEVVVNRLRPGPVPGKPEDEVRAVLARYGGVDPVAVLSEDGPAADRALARGRCLAEVAPDSRLRLEIVRLARSLADGAAGGRVAPDRGKASWWDGLGARRSRPAARGRRGTGT